MSDRSKRFSRKKTAKAQVSPRESTGLRYVALARVSSASQAKEGFSLDVQEEALTAWAANKGGSVVKMFRVTETASKQEHRTVFREVLEYCRRQAASIDGLLVYKIDRAARNLYDFVEIERLEHDHGVPMIAISQPSDRTPAGKLSRRILASIAAFYTDQLADDVRDGHRRRVDEGLFPARPPYGYLTVRRNGRSVIETEPLAAGNIRRIFRWYAWEAMTVDAVHRRLAAEAVPFSAKQPKWVRSKIHTILCDRSYLGEVFYADEWHVGTHEALVDRATWDRVQSLLGAKIYREHALVYGCERITCGHCGRTVTGEEIRKKDGRGGHRVYTYYRCARYNTEGHPRVRVTEAELDRQVVAVLAGLKQDQEIAEWFRGVLKAREMGRIADTTAQRAELRRQDELLCAQADRLLNTRLAGTISEELHAAKAQELRDRQARVREQLDVLDRMQSEAADAASRVFELAQVLDTAWLTADVHEKRAILDAVCLNLALEGKKLVIRLQKPFDLLASGDQSEKNWSNQTRVEHFAQSSAGIDRVHRHRIDRAFKLVFARWNAGVTRGQ